MSSYQGISFSGDGIIGSSSSSTSAGGNKYAPTGLGAEAGMLPGSYPSAVDAERVNKYETSLPVRLNILAPLAYVLAPISGKKKVKDNQ